MDTIFNADIFQINHRDIANMIGESNRFIMHVLLMHIVSVIIVKKDDLFGTSLYQTIIMTILAIILYHLLFRKAMEPYLEKMKTSYAVEIDIDSIQNKDNDNIGKEQTRQKTNKPPIRQTNPTIRQTNPTIRQTNPPTKRTTIPPTNRTTRTRIIHNRRKNMYNTKKSE